MSEELKFTVEQIKDIPREVVALSSMFYTEGFEIYAVGGCVRDLYLNRTPHDWDLCTSATPEQTMAILKKFGVSFTTIGIEFGTVEAQWNGSEYEITTFRKDGNYSDSRHPDEVKYSTNIYDDLQRRDFTINSIAYDCIRDKFVTLDGAVNDLKNRVLRCVGDPDERFNEDPLRILRALRFKVVMGLSIESKTSDKMHELKELLKTVSKERVTDEFRKMLSARTSIKEGFMEYSDVVFTLISELQQCFKFDQKNKYHQHDVYEHMLYVTDYCNTYIEKQWCDKEKTFVIRLAGLLHDIGKPDCFTVDENGQGHFYKHPVRSAEICKVMLKKNFRLTLEEYNEVMELVEHHDMDLGDTPKSVKRALNRFGLDFMKMWCVIKQADKDDHVNVSGLMPNVDVIRDRIDSIVEAEQCFSLKGLAISGNEVMSLLGIKPGKTVGLILQTLLSEVIDDKIENDPEILKGRASELFGEDISK